MSNRHQTRISRDELDRLFDREMTSAERRDFVGRVGQDPLAIDEVNDLRGIFHTMRLRPDETPDMSEAILGRLDASRGFLSPRLRRRVKAGRMAVAACLLLGLLGVAAVQRLAPDRFRLRGAATPVADLTDAVQQDSIEGRRRLTDAVQSLASAHAEANAFVRARAGEASEPLSVVFDDASSDGPWTGSVAGAREVIADRHLSLRASIDSEILDLKPVGDESIASSGFASGLLVGTPSGRAGEVFAGDFGSAGTFGADFAPFGFASLQTASLQTASLETAALGLRSDSVGFSRRAFESFDPDLFGPIAGSGRLTLSASRPAAEAFTVGKGIVPMSFSSRLRSAYVGPRDTIAPAIKRANDELIPDVLNQVP